MSELAERLPARGMSAVVSEDQLSKVTQIFRLFLTLTLTLTCDPIRI